MILYDKTNLQLTAQIEIAWKEANFQQRVLCCYTIKLSRAPSSDLAH